MVKRHKSTGITGRKIRDCRLKDNKMISEEILKCSSLVKEVSPSFTLGSIDISIKNGETVALIGPNGAGKTTLFQLITGNSDPTTGEISYKSERFRPEHFDTKRNFGYLSQDIALPQWVTPKELLNYSASLHNLKNKQKVIDEQIDLWDIRPFLNRPVASCSHGMKKRAGLATALLHDPDFLILDEPFAGLDILHINSLKKTIKDRANRNKSCIISTHILPYASEICSRALIIRKGSVTEIETWSDLDYTKQQSTIENYFFPRDENT